MAADVIYQGEVLDAKRYDDYKTKAAASILAAVGISPAAAMSRS